MRAVTLLVFALAVAFGPGTAAHAQTPIPTGVISGTVRNGTAGTGLPALQIQLIGVPPSGTITSQQTMTTGGRFRFEAPADSTITYLLRTEYAGVPYLTDAPILISRELPTVEHDLTVWETTATRPALRIDSTEVTARALAREQGALTLDREDIVFNSTDRVYVGSDDHVTYRVPAPDAVLAVDAGQSFDGAVALQGETIVSTRPLRPGANSIVTTMVVGYDHAADAYHLRVTAPLPTKRMEAWVPARFARSLRTEHGSRRDTADRDGEHWLVARATTASLREGESLLLTIEGLSGANTENPLTARRGAAIAVALALTVLVGAFTALDHLRRAPARATS